MHTRSATAADSVGIALLVEQYWACENIGGFDRGRVTVLLEDFLGHPEFGCCWVVEQQQSLCGYLLAVFLFSLEHGGRMAEIDELFVTPELRSAGVGSLLLAAAERDLGQRGLVRMQLQLGTGNRRGRLFYERQGYRSRSGYELMDKPL